MSVAAAGYRVNFLVRAHGNQWTGHLFDRLRRSSGVHVYGLNRLRRALQALERNEVVCMLADEPTTQTVAVSGGRRPLAVARGPFRIAYHTRSRVLPSFAVWERGTGQQKSILEPAITVYRSGNEERDVVHAAREFGRVFERYLRAHPDHWLLLQKHSG